MSSSIRVTYRDFSRFILFFDLIVEGVSLEDQLIFRKEVLDSQSKDLVKSNVRFINEGKDLELSGDYITLFHYCFHLQNRILDKGYLTSGPYGSLPKYKRYNHQLPSVLDEIFREYNPKDCLLQIKPISFKEEIEDSQAIDMWTEFLLTATLPNGKILECTTLLSFVYMQRCLDSFILIQKDYEIIVNEQLAKEEDLSKNHPIYKEDLHYKFYRNSKLIKIEPFGEFIILGAPLDF
jgi:hypothetical protein